MKVYKFTKDYYFDDADGNTVSFTVVNDIFSSKKRALSHKDFVISDCEMDAEEFDNCFVYSGICSAENCGGLLKPLAGVYSHLTHRFTAVNIQVMQVR